MSKIGNFSEWYQTVLFDAGIVDIRYPVKGMPVYMPWGFQSLDYMFSFLEKLLDETGHQKMLFPVAIPESTFSKETEHIKGFEDEVLWITHGGLAPLEERLVLRPTSETAMYPMFALWARSHADLPIKIYQTTSVYRHETKATRPLIRGREVYWNEAHTSHATLDEAAQNVEEAIKIYSEFYKALCIPFVVIKRPEFDKFAGALYTYAFDTVMPDGRTLQIATAHNLGDNFAKAYDVKYSTETGEQRYACQTSYGISMRGLAAVISIHGDEKGLKLPFEIAPVQIVFVPIYSKDNNAAVDAVLRPVYESLRTLYRCRYDDSRKRPGEKYYFWELKGVPLRIEAGMRDLSEGKVTLVDRNGTKKQVAIAGIADEIPRAVDAYHKKLYADAKAFFDRHQFTANTVKELREMMDEYRGMIRIGWCGSMECAEELDKLEVGKILGYEKGNAKKRKCIICGRDGDEVIISKSY
ncbi:MAG: proline--tRNA ligase [Candidatus Micrarchaeota archaeon]|nr:proline--tRNA ligase [Candidatus Micrarchaeota archaeon]